MLSKQPVYGRSLSGRLILAAFLLFAVAAMILFAGTRAAHAPFTAGRLLPSKASSGLTPQVMAHYAERAAIFERNDGQTDPQVKFLSRGPSYTLFLTGSEAVLSLDDASPKSDGERGIHSAKFLARPNAAHVASLPSTRTVLRMRLAGTHSRAQIAGENRLPGVSNYYIGNSPNQWHTAVPQYSRVRYREVYPGVDLAFHGAQKQLEFDFIVKPGASPQQIKLQFSGARQMRQDDDGSLVLATDAGDLHLHKPVAYQQENGARQPVSADFVLNKNQVGFALGSYDRRRELVIDPTVTYATYLGGTGEDEATAVAADNAGNVYLTGQTSSVNFPNGSISPHQGTLGGAFDAFVSKLDPTGATLLYSSYLGGSSNDGGNAVAVDNGGMVYIAGATNSSGTGGFPTTPGVFQSTNKGTENAFAAKFDSTSGSLVYSTCLGGSGSDVANGLAIDSSGQAYVVGDATSLDFPTTGTVGPGFQTIFGGNDDAFVSVLNNSATALVYSTFLGGANSDVATAVALVPGSTGASTILVAGITFSPKFPVKNAYQGTCGTDGNCNSGLDDAFIAQIDPTVSGNASLLYSTFLGGSGADRALGVAADSTGVYATGLTASKDFPTKNPFQASLKSTQNAFVTKINPAVSGTAGLLYSTYLGGSGTDQGTGIALDFGGNAYVTGSTTSTDFPTQSPTQSGFGGGSTDAFVSVLSSAGNTLLFSTYLGGSGSENFAGPALGAIAVDPNNNIYVAGSTTGSFPVVKASQAGFGGLPADAFVAKFSPAAASFSLTASAPSPNPVAKGSSATSTITLNAPSGFNQTVALSCTGPSGITCSPNPASLTSSATTSTLTINVSSSALLKTPGINARSFYVLWLPVPGIALVGIGLGSLRSRSQQSRKNKLLVLLAICFLIVALAFLMGCGSSSGGGGGGGGGTTPYSVTVTGTANNLSSTVTVSGSFK